MDDDPIFTDLFSGPAVSIADEDVTLVAIVERAHRRVVRRRVLAGALATVLIGAIGTGVAVGATRHSTVVRVQGAADSTTTVPAAASCPNPEKGVAPNGETYGTVPPQHGGGAPLPTPPDYVAVTPRTGGGIAGYVERADMYAVPAKPMPVYACDLTTIVGYFVPGTGFVPLGGGTPLSLPSPTSTAVPQSSAVLGVEVANPGTLVIGVIANSPAVAMGIQAGDTIVSVNGKSTATQAAIASVLRDAHPGDEVQVSWKARDGSLHFGAGRLVEPPTP